MPTYLPTTNLSFAALLTAAGKANNMSLLRNTAYYDISGNTYSDAARLNMSNFFGKTFESPVQPPTVPQNFAATYPAAGNITLQWTPPASAGGGGATITSYEIQYNTTTTTVSGSLNPLELLVTGLTIGTPITFTIYATNSSGLTSVLATLTVTPITPATLYYAGGFNFLYGGPVRPGSLCLDSFKNLYVADNQNRRIVKITPSKIESIFATFGFYPPTSICCDSNNNIYVSVDGQHIIYKFDSVNYYYATNSPAPIIYGTIYTSGFADSPASPLFYNPSAICCDKNNNVYVVDTNNLRIRKITPSGDVSTIAGNGVFAGYTTVFTYNTPLPALTTPLRIVASCNSITIDSNNNIYFIIMNPNVDTFYIIKLSIDGNVTWVAGYESFEDPPIYGQGNLAKIGFTSMYYDTNDTRNTIYMLQASGRYVSNGISAISKMSPTYDIVKLQQGIFNASGQPNTPFSVVYDYSTNTLYYSAIDNKIYTSLAS